MNEIELTPITPDLLRLMIGGREVVISLDDALDFQYRLACALSLMEDGARESVLN